MQELIFDLRNIKFSRQVNFQIARDELGSKWERIPSDTDILVSITTSINNNYRQGVFLSSSLQRIFHFDKCEQVPSN